MWLDTTALVNLMPNRIGHAVMSSKTRNEVRTKLQDSEAST